ncbi:ribosome small subunit-dependent GTPase A [Bacillus spongiae]|uniref:Small ribosomal subunit biogenesis GTPase RsgA n=1 Tax=Bacillus spongiae TaxID=2683610 RepID=A0ABU8HDP6_9BACI
MEKNNQNRMNVKNESNRTVTGRVIKEMKQVYKVLVGDEEINCKLPGKFYYQHLDSNSYPAIGDWVTCEMGSDDFGFITSVHPRTSKFSRMKAGSECKEQIIATNVDTLFIVSSLNEDINVRRLERYLMLAHESGAAPVFLLSKGDLCSSIAKVMADLNTLSKQADIIPLSCQEGWGLEKLEPYLQPEKTVAFVGSSGVGKSTIVNYLMGDNVQKTLEIRDKDGKGKHTTTVRELFYLQNGTAVIDTPGMREIQIWEGKSGLEVGFEDIETLSSRCFFRNCQHVKEHGCAVLEAIENGTLEQQRFQSYRKLQKEQEFNKRKSDLRAQLDEKKVWKQRSKKSRRNRR